MGHIHDVNVEKISEYFKVKKDFYRNVKFDERLLKKSGNSQSHFFMNGYGTDFIDTSMDLSVFQSKEEAYHQFVSDLTELCYKSIQLILPENNDIKTIFVSGGFARNEIFINCLAAKFPGKKILTPEFDNSSALGAAMTVIEQLK
jgi:sugar (pentulose or hexulose) kinase